MPKSNIQKFGEWLPDQSPFQHEGLTEAKNVIPVNTGYIPLKGFLNIAGSVLNNTCAGGIQVSDDQNFYWYAADNAGSLYRGAGGRIPTSWIDASARTYTTNNLFNWQFLSWKNKVYACWGYEWPQSITLGGTTFADLTTDVAFVCMGVINNFLVGGNTYDPVDGYRARRLRWSAINDPTDWTVSSATQADYQDLASNAFNGGGAVRAISGGDDYGVILQDFTIRRMTYSGSPTIFQIDETLPGYGCISHSCIAQVGDSIFLLGQDGFYVVTNGAQLQPIGEGKVNRTFFNKVNPSKISLVSTAIDGLNKCIYWFYPGKGFSRPTEVVIYNYAFNKWSWGEITLDFAFTGWPRIGYSSLTPVCFSWSHTLSYFDGNALSARIETAEKQYTPGLMTHISSVRPLVDRAINSPQVKLGFRNRQQDVTVYTDASTSNDYGECEFRNEARYHSVRLDLSGNFEWALGYDITLSPGGDRGAKTYGYTSISLDGLFAPITLAGQEATIDFSNWYYPVLATLTLAGQSATYVRDHRFEATVGGVSLSGAAADATFS